jgi:hypothetical protein
MYGAADDAAYVAAVRTKHKAQVLSTDQKSAAKKLDTAEDGKASGK